MKKQKDKEKENQKGNQKEKQDPNKRQVKGRTLRDLIPSNSPHLKNLRELSSISYEQDAKAKIQEIKDFIIISKPEDLFPEWPDELTLNVK